MLPRLSVLERGSPENYRPTDLSPKGIRHSHLSGASPSALAVETGSYPSPTNLVHHRSQARGWAATSQARYRELLTALRRIHADAARYH